MQPAQRLRSHERRLLQSPPQAVTPRLHPLPRGPVLDWSSFQRIDAPGVPSIEGLSHTTFTTSGRAAIYQALLQLDLPAGSTVLVPTYHCPTMVAPVLLAHLKVAYFGLRPDGLPNLNTIPAELVKQCKAILVSHYFGLAHSLAEVRAWCDTHGVALIEDCAHCYFGEAGERTVGAWGDFSTASLSKFLPVPEAGLLASAVRPIKPFQLAAPSLKAQTKGWIDVVELATRYQRLAGIRPLLAPLFRLKNARAQTPVQPGSAAPAPEVSMMRDCDMGRIDQAPLWAAMSIKTMLPRGRIIARRQKNFSRYAPYFANTPGAHPLFASLPATEARAAPYVFPLWVDNPEPIYQALRMLELPVFRWDRIWPGTPRLADDVGSQWSHHVLQLLCHQDLDDADIDRTALAIVQLLQKHSV
jgi:perosamine synthetase